MSKDKKKPFRLSEHGVITVANKCDNPTAKYVDVDADAERVRAVLRVPARHLAEPDAPQRDPEVDVVALLVHRRGGAREPGGALLPRARLRRRTEY